MTQRNTMDLNRNPHKFLDSGCRNLYWPSAGYALETRW